MPARLAFAFSLLALGACQPPTSQSAEHSQSAGQAQGSAAPETATVAATNCNVRVESPWIDQETPLRRYTAEASVIGPTCQQGVALLVIRAREGSPIYTWSGLVDYLFGLKDATDPASMKRALNDWISQGDPLAGTTASLPPWEETDGQPKRAEFPFMPETWIDNAAWDQLKKDKLDMFCFPQGMESSKCVALRSGEDGAPPAMEEIGLQRFPG